jgi:hypothetical protein
VTFLTRRLPGLPATEAKAAAGKVAGMSAHLGHYAFLRRVADRLASQPDDMDAVAIISAATALKATLETR